MSPDYAVIDTIYGKGLVDRGEIAATCRFVPKRAMSDIPQIVLTLRNSAGSVYMVDSRENCEAVFGAEWADRLGPPPASAEPRQAGKARPTARSPRGGRRRKPEPG